MRVHIQLEDELVEEIHRRSGPRGRSRYIERAVREALERDRRWDLIWSAVGSIADEGHEWDADVADWVHTQRRADPRRVG